MFTVPGKRKRNSGAKKSDAKPSSRTGRPMKRAKELSISKAAVQKQLKHQVNTTAPLSENPLSLLEQLPNELIQQIFFHCFEVNLPRASLRLAHALSTESTYNALILFAFFEDDGHNPVETKLFLPAIYTMLEPDARIRLQEDVLLCQWFNLERLRTAMPALSLLAMTQEWHRERTLEMDLMSSYTSDIQVKVILDLDRGNRDTPFDLDDLQELSFLPELKDFDGVCRHFFAKAYHNTPSGVERDIALDADTDSERYLPRILTWTVYSDKARSDGQLYLKKCPRHARSILATRVFPDRLVKGNPWTSDKIEMLQLLRQGSRFPRDYPESLLDVSASAIFDGMASAIKEDNDVALMTLLEIHNDVFKDENFGNSFLQPPSPQTPARILHAATRAGARSSEFIKLFLRASLTSFPTDDNLLTAWAIREQAKGDPTADLLLDYMSGPKNSGGRLRNSRFKSDNVSPNVEGDPLLLESRDATFHEELGYLSGCMPTSSLRINQTAD